MSVAARTLPVENEEARIFTLLSQVCEDSKAAAGNRLDFSQLHERIMQLEKFIFSFSGDQAATRAILKALTPEMIAALNDAYCLWETRLEYQFVEKYAKRAASLPDYFLHDRLDALTRRELAFISGIKPQQMLFVGSGPLPINAILMHLQTGLPVDCVVRELEMLASAQQALEICELNTAVRVFHDRDPDYDVSGYDFIIIGHLARSRKSLLKTLRKRCPPGCQILCRTSDGLRRLLYEAASDRDLRGFHVKAEQLAEGSQTISIKLIEAASSAAVDVRLEWLRGIDSDLAGQLLCLMNRTLEEETTIGFPGPIDDETGYSLMRQLNEDVESGHRHVLVAEKDGVIVGQLILTPNSSPNHRHIVELTRGTIHPSFRGGGLALRAFQEVARKCEELGREVICLDVRAGTMAAIWWQHFGFKPYGLLSDYSRVGDKTYQGLYLTQTTADLKQRVEELARTPVSADSILAGVP